MSNIRYVRRPLKPQERFRVLERDGFSCRYCGQSAPSVILHVDHIKPVSAGGSNHPDNLCAACSSCNAGKAGAPVKWFAAQREFALCAVAIEAALIRFGPFEMTHRMAMQIMDFISGSESPQELIGLVESVDSYADMIDAWLEHEGYPERLKRFG